MLLIILGVVAIPNHNIFAILTLFFGFLSAYMFSTLFFRKIRIEKLVILTIGVFFSFITLFGFLMKFFGMEIRLLYFLLVFVILSMILYYWRRRTGFKTPRVEVDKNRILIFIVIFLVSFCFYIYPALPTMSSACTPGFDCTYHMEYAQSIYEQKRPITPIVQWSYYPYGLHTNIALLSECLTTSKPGYTNVIYPFMTLVTALIITMTCLLLWDRKINKIYTFPLLAMLLLSVYPASALIGYGFWPQLFGIFFTILFFLVLNDYMKEPRWKMVILLGLLSIASFLSYHMITSAITIIGFVIAILVSRHWKHLLLFLLVFILVFSANTLDNYLSYLSSDVEIYMDTYSNTYSSYESVILTLEERHSLNLKSFQAFVLIHQRQLEQGGEIVFFNLARLGFIIILLAIIAVVFTKRYDASIILLISVSLEMFFFYWKMNVGGVSSYYFSKIPYILIYPLILSAIIGVERIVREVGNFWKKASFVVIVALLIIGLLYITNGNKWAGLIIGDNEELFKATRITWCRYITFNRVEHFYALDQGRDPHEYGFLDWLISVASACKETDMGRNIYEQGTCLSNHNDNPKQDYCSSSAHLQEFYCSGDSCVENFVACPDGFQCADGACVTTTTTTTTTLPSCNNDCASRGYGTGDCYETPPWPAIGIGDEYCEVGSCWCRFAITTTTIEHEQGL